MPDLVRLLDPAELDVAEGPHGTMSIEVSAAQLGERIAIIVPARVACGRCEGGGCDRCGRSGAVRLELDEEQRTTHVVLPKDAGDRLRIRLMRPLGDSAGLEQLTLDLRLTAAPAPASAKPALDARSALLAAALVVAAAMALAAMLR